MKENFEFSEIFHRASGATLKDENPSLSKDNKSLVYVVELPATDNSGTVVFELRERRRVFGIKEELTIHSYRRGLNGNASDHTTVTEFSVLRSRGKFATDGDTADAFKKLNNNLDVAGIPARPSRRVVPR
jgi:hypothetical protein